MINLIILVVLVVVGFFTRNIWSKWLLILFKRKPITRVEPIGQSAVIFSPKGSVRSFVVSVDIEEQGDGTVKMSIGKVKGVEV